MSTAANIRLLVVDDHPVVRAGLRTVQEIAPELQIVGEAGSAQDALVAAKQLQPHVILLDIRLGGQSGIEVCREIKRAFPTIRVLFLTSYAEDKLILAALEAGADGYLLKESDTRRLVDAIRELVQGGSVFDPQVTRSLATGRKDATAPASSKSLNALTPQERSLLAEIAKGKTDKEVAEAMGLTAKTARNYLDRVFTKLNVRNRTEAALLYVRAVERD